MLLPLLRVLGMFYFSTCAIEGSAKGYSDILLVRPPLTYFSLMELLVFLVLISDA